MTREEAITILKQTDRIGCNLIKANDEKSTKYNQESIEALGMAIKALEQEPCEDCISRQAIDQNIYDYAESNGLSYTNMKNYILDVPSVTPTRKKGKWIEEDMLDYADEIITNGRCSCCNFADNIYLVRNFNFCPKCGADMRWKNDTM